MIICRKSVFSLFAVVLSAYALLGPTAARGGQFPSQELDSLDGGRTALNPDSTVCYTVLDFWALWCAPCIVALPEIENLAQEMKAHPVRFILINCDNTRSRAKVRSFIRSKGLETTVLLDPSQGLMRYYGISSLPHLLVLDSVGKVIERKSGYMSGDELLLEEKLLELLDK